MVQKDKIKYRGSVYTDDLVVFLSPSTQDFANIRRILHLFGHQRRQVPHHADTLFH
jgi:hypothetical protein